MLLEALQHLVYPAPKYIKKLGYLHEAIAIEARFKRCSHHWLPHLNKCKAMVVNAASRLPKGAKIMIIGSGGLHDVPIDWLLQKGYEIECIDIVHLPNVRKEYPQINFREKDITGIAEALYHQRNDLHLQMHSYEPLWTPKSTPDLVISLNIMSQLPIALSEFAKNNQITLPESFEANIRLAHAKWLKEIGSNILLITDIDRRYFHKGEHIKSTRAITEADNQILGLPQEQWIWNIAPAGETDKYIGIEHTVGCWVFRS